MINGVQIGFLTPTHTLQIISPNGKQFCLDFSGDTLKSSGDLIPDEAALEGGDSHV